MHQQPLLQFHKNGSGHIDRKITNFDRVVEQYVTDFVDKCGILLNKI